MIFHIKPELFLTSSWVFWKAFAVFITCVSQQALTLWPNTWALWTIATVLPSWTAHGESFSVAQSLPRLVSNAFV